VLVVEIDPKRPDPHLRTDWKIPDLGQYLHLHRGELLAAMLTIARAWYVKGQEQDRDRGDDYAGWAGSLRVMLRDAGIPGRFGGETSTIASKVDPETVEWAEFLREIYRVKGSEPFTVKELVHVLANNNFTDTGVDAHTLPGDLAHKFAAIRDGKSTGFSRSLGLWLRHRADRYAEGWKIERATADAHGSAWQVVPPEKS
jgi:hypothetical protein